MQQDIRVQSTDLERTSNKESRRGDMSIFPVRGNRIDFPGELEAGRKQKGFGRRWEQQKERVLGEMSRIMGTFGRAM